MGQESGPGYRERGQAGRLEVGGAISLLPDQLFCYSTSEKQQLLAR